MKVLSSGEKFALIRAHGDALSRVNMAVMAPKRSDVIERAQRVIELAKAIPKAEWGSE